MDHKAMPKRLVEKQTSKAIAIPMSNKIILRFMA